jgi:hypothetical protein
VQNHPEAPEKDGKQFAGYGLAQLRAGQLDPGALARAVAATESAGAPPTHRTRGEVLGEMLRDLP